MLLPIKASWARLQMDFTGYHTTIRAIKHTNMAGIVGAHAIPPQPDTETSHSQPKASSDHDNHQYGGAENHHDNTYISEAAMTGTHAVPPMTFHARHDLKEKPKQENQKMKQLETQ
ncbi:hypothetical protein BG000_001384 [Podila horticola]|nr:hypothetical protein BG000_001384 [Podila horticola]